MCESFDFINETVLEAAPTQNRIPDGISPPVFLKRNLKTMRKVRGKQDMHQSNGLTVRPLPILNSLNFENGTEDFMFIKRMRKTRLSIKDQFKQDLQKRVDAQQTLLKRAKKN